MTGSDGADGFIFDTALGAANIDTITDYSAAADTIRLENAIFTALTTLGTLAAGAFVYNSTGVATQTDDRVIYESDTAWLYYDKTASMGQPVSTLQRWVGSDHEFKIMVEVPDVTATR